MADRRHKLLFVSGTVTFLAMQVQVISQAWLANVLTSSNVGVGGLYLAFGVPLLLATPLAGVAADRYSKRAILMAVQIAHGATALWIAIGSQLGWLQYWMLLVASAIQAVGFAFLTPARTAMTSEIVSAALLTNAIVLGQLSLNVTRLLGPALAGPALDWPDIGVRGVLYFAGALFTVGLLFLLPLTTTTQPPSRQRPKPLHDFADALRYVRGDRDVMRLMLTAFFVLTIAFPYVAFLPRIATELYGGGSASYGALAASAALGAVMMSLVLARRTGRRDMFRLQTAMGICFGAGVLLIAMAHSFPLSLLAVALTGAAASGFQSMNHSLVLNLSSPTMHGRLQSLMMLAFSGFGIAALPLGILADTVGLRFTYAAMGTSAILVTVVGRLARTRRAKQ